MEDNNGGYENMYASSEKTVNILSNIIDTYSAKSTNADFKEIYKLLKPFLIEDDDGNNAVDYLMTTKITIEGNCHFS